MKAREYLSKIRQLDDAIGAAISSRDRYIAMARGLRSPVLNGEVRGRAGSSIEATVEKLTETERRIESLIDRYLLEREQITRMISGLGDERHRQILTLRYIEFKRLEDIACIMRKKDGSYYSYQHIRRLHGYALAEFTRRYLTKS